MKKNIAFLALCIALISSLSYGQDSQKNTYSDNSTESFNLPPGAVFNPKTYIEIDYREQLQFSKYDQSVDKNYLQEFSDTEIVNMKENYPNDYKYYSNALKYFNSLPVKVKKTFTVDELWYIYKFDQRLKKTLQTIN